MEKTVESYLVSQVRAAGGRAPKFISPGWTGVPDRLILMPGGRACFAELKDRGKYPRANQRRAHEILRGLGFRVYIPRSREDVDAMMKEVVS